MAAPNYSGQGWVARTLSKARAIIDGGSSDVTGPRFSRYQEQMCLAPMMGEPLLCDEGALMISSMLPGATTLQCGVVASYSATASAILTFKNNAPAGPSSPRCHLRDIHWSMSNAPGSATQWNYATVTDNVNRAPTTVSGIGSPGTPGTLTAYQAPAVCTNIDENPVINGVWWFPMATAAGGAPTVPAQGPNARIIVGNGLLRGGNFVALDDVRITFGPTDRPAGQIVTAAPSGASRIVEPHPAVTIGPQEFFLLYLWGASNATTGPAFIGLDCSWFER